MESADRSGRCRCAGAEADHGNADLYRGAANDWHVGPRRQFVITLSGRAEIEVAGGQKVPIGPGQINLIEDTTGKGHITRNLGPDDRIVVTIPLDK